MAKKYKVFDDERYPTLYLDENNLGWYDDEECEEIPDFMVEELELARKKLYEAEDQINDFLKRK